VSRQHFLHWKLFWQRHWFSESCTECFDTKHYLTDFICHSAAVISRPSMLSRVLSVDGTELPTNGFHLMSMYATDTTFSRRPVLVNSRFRVTVSVSYWNTNYILFLIQHCFHKQSSYKTIYYGFELPKFGGLAPASSYLISVACVQQGRKILLRRFQCVLFTNSASLHGLRQKKNNGIQYAWNKLTACGRIIGREAGDQASQVLYCRPELIYDLSS